MERELERLKERAPTEDDYDRWLRYKIQRRRQALQGMVLIKGSEVPWQ